MMTAIGIRTEQSQPSSFRAPRRSAALVGGAAAALLVLVYGGYGHHWSWTGVNGKTATLWDWLHLLLLPLAAGILPIAVRQRGQLQARHKAASLGVVSAFAVLVLVGYAIPWQWTGFPGNKLWDWLELLALPLAIALIPVVHDLHADWDRPRWVILFSGLLAVTAFVVAAYVGDWEWTGFRGNTLWDWLHLLLLPLLVPAIAVPALKRAATTRLPHPELQNAAAEQSHPDQSSAARAPSGP